MGWEERRQYRRAFIKFMVEYRGKSSWQMIEARDISAGGMFIVTDTVEPPNSEVEIMFELEMDDKRRKFVHAKGLVAWNRSKGAHDSQGTAQPAGMGIKFVKLSPLSAKDFINEIVTKLEEKPDA